jgi:hypothetical protein
MLELAPRSVQKSPTLVLRTVASLGNQYMTVELTQSSRSKLVTTVATVLRSLVEIGAAIKNSFGMSHPASAGKRTESLMETESVAIPEIRAQVEVEAHAEINAVARDELDQQEIERRRNLVRTLFNDFWSGEDKKPLSFTARLDQAEDYMNERLAANGETWRLDNETRVILGLPRRPRSPD